MERFFPRLNLTWLSALLALTVATEAFAVRIEAKGRLARGNEIADLNLDITLYDVPATDLINNSVEDTIHARLEVFFKGEDLTNGGLPIRFSADNTEVQKLEGWELISTQSPVHEQQTGTANFIVTASYRLHSTGTNKTFQDLLADDGKVTLELIYKTGNGTTEEEKEKMTLEVTQQVGVVNEAPSEVTAKAEHKGVSITWSKPNTVAFNEGPADTPTGMDVFLIDVEAADGSVTLPAKTYQADKSAETEDASCTVDISGDSCSVSCSADGVYISVSSAKSVTGVKEVATVPYPTAKKSFTDLNADKSYALFAMYEPDGLARSECFVVQPKENFTLSEANGADPAEATDPTCFIATAAYGSPLHPHLDTLRWFRDHILLSTGAGRDLVQTYYRLSPPLAAWIAETPPARWATRSLLWAPVMAIGAYQKAPAMTVLTVLIAVISIVFFWRRRAKHAV